MKSLEKESHPSIFSRLIASMTLCLFLFVFFALGAIAAEKKSQDEKKPQYGGILRTSIPADPRSMDPHMETYFVTTMVTLNTNNNLIRFNPKMNGVEPELAASWKQIDELTYEFKLNKGVHFHNVPPVNGRELTSEDVKYSIERVAGMHGKKTDFRHRPYFEDKIKSIETPDKYTIIFKTTEPYAPFITYLSSPWCAIVAKEVVDQYGDLKNHAIGTGPFILKEFVRGSHITLIRNPNYWQKERPYLDRIQIKVMADPASVLAAFIAGRLDKARAYHYQLPTIKKEAPDTLINRFKGITVFILRCPPWIEDKKPLKPPFDNKKVRQAIAMAIDKKKLVKLTLGGFGDTVVGPIPPSVKYALPEADQVKYDPKKAKQLLAEAGYPSGFSTELLTWNQEYVTTPAQVIKEMLKEIGIEVKLTFLEISQYANRAQSFNYEMALHGMIAGVEPEEWLVPYFGPLDGAPYYKWSNKEIWKLIQEQSRIMNPKKRQSAIQEIQKKIMADFPNVFLYTQDRFDINKPYVHVTKPYQHELQNLYGEFIWMEKH